MPDKDPWSRSFLTPSPHSSDSDSNSEDEKGKADKPGVSISRDADLYRDLDLSNRDDRAVFRQNPFTLAKTQGAKKGKGNAERGGEEVTKKKGNIQPATLDGRPPPVEDEPVKNSTNGKTRVTAEPDRPPPFRAPQYRRNGWYDNHNKPILVAPPPKRQPPPKRSLTDTLDDGAATSAKGKGKTTKKGVTKGKRGGKGEEEDRPVFSRIPAGAAPNDQYPIVKGIERQKALPAKAKKEAPPIVLRPDSTEDALPEFDIDTLVGGLSSSGTKEARRNAKTTRSSGSAATHTAGHSSHGLLGQDGVRKQGDAVSKTSKVSRHFAPPEPIAAVKKQSSQATDHTSTRLPSLYRSGPTVDTDDIATPVESDQDSNDPSTITKLPSFELKTAQKRTRPDHMSSSSQLPYSSPLWNKHVKIIRPNAKTEVTLYEPRPVKAQQIRANDLESLETQALHDHPPIQSHEFYDHAPERKPVHGSRENNGFPYLTRTVGKADPDLDSEDEMGQYPAYTNFGNDYRQPPDYPRKRLRSPDEGDQPAKQARHRATEPTAGYDMHIKDEPRSPPPVWSTLNQPKRSRTQQGRRRPSSPKLSEKFRMPLNLFPRSTNRRAVSPDIPKLVPTKASLFTPSRPARAPRAEDFKPTLKLETRRGLPQFGAVINARQEASPRPPGVPSHQGHSSQPVGIYGNRYEAPQQRQAAHDQPQEAYNSDWTQAWKRQAAPTVEPDYRPPTNPYAKFKYARRDDDMRERAIHQPGGRAYAI